MLDKLCVVLFLLINTFVHQGSCEQFTISHDRQGMSRQLILVLEKDLARDEGVIYKIYKDSFGYLTFGIGHLIVKGDPEYGKPVNTPVSKRRVDEAFQIDLQTALRGCPELFPDFASLPNKAKLVIANMMFNLGVSKLRKFKKFRAAVENRDWNRAADEMVDSSWYRQVGARARCLVAMIRSLAEDDQVNVFYKAKDRRLQRKNVI